MFMRKLYLNGGIRTLVCIISLIGSILLGLGGVVSAVPQQRVILISIDGIRNSEGFGYPNCWGQQGCGDCNQLDHPYIPRLWGCLKPEGTLYTSGPNSLPQYTSTFINNLATWTTPGHETMLTGVRIGEANKSNKPGMHPFRPTIFELLRKQLNLTEDEVAAVVSKANTEQLNFSLDPLHGPDYKAANYYIHFDDPAEDNVDYKVAITGQCLMRGLKPDTINYNGCTADTVPPPYFLFLHFRDVDHFGHKGCFKDGVPNPTDCPSTPGVVDTYTEAIQEVDRLIYEYIWQEIVGGTNPYFNPTNTTLLVTTDHGRHDYNFKSHGTLNWADRAIFLLAIGPGIVQNQVITNIFRQHEDVVPTIGSIFGISTPEAEGVVMAELWGGSQGIFPYQRSEVRAMAVGGYLHVVWSQRNTTTGDREIWYQRIAPSTVPNGWTIPVPNPNPQPVKLSLDADSSGNQLTNTQPALYVRGQNVHVAWHATKSPRQGGDNRTDVYYRRGQGGGTDWTLPPEVVAQSLSEFTTTNHMFYYAPTTVLEVEQSTNSRRVWVITSKFSNTLLGFYKNLPDGLWTQVTIVTDEPCTEDPTDPDNERVCPPPQYKAAYAQHTRAAAQGTNVEVVWQALEDDDYRWRVFRGNHRNWGVPTEWTITQEALPNNPVVQTYLPSVEYQGNNLNILWTDNRVVEAGEDPAINPVWRIWGNQSTSAISGPQSFLPSVVAKNATFVYSAYSRVNPATGNYDIFWNKSDNGGVYWPNETLLTPVGTSPGPSLWPSIAFDNKMPLDLRLWVVWGEWNGTDWDIKGLPISNEN